MSNLLFDFRPQLAVNVPVNYETLPYPLFVSEKMDGIRALVTPKGVFSRSGKPFPNRALASLFPTSDRILDGEIWSPNIPFQNIQSIVMSHNADIPDDLKFCAFDSLRVFPFHLGLGESYYLRYAAIPEEYRVAQVECDYETAIDMFNQIVARGGEGVMLRRKFAPYKCGRVTVREGYIFKMKAEVESQGIVIGTNPKRRQISESTEQNELGFAKRQYRADQFELTNEIGSYNVRLDSGLEVSVCLGKGCQIPFVGDRVTVRSIKCGVKIAPRGGHIVKVKGELQ